MSDRYSLPLLRLAQQPNLPGLEGIDNSALELLGDSDGQVDKRAGREWGEDVALLESEAD